MTKRQLMTKRPGINDIVKGSTDISALFLQAIFFRADEITKGIATLTDCRKIQVIPPSSSCLGDCKFF